MSRSLLNILFAIAGFIGLLILLAVALIFFVDTSVYKPRLERAASEALGMEIHVNGQLGLAFFPDLHVRLEDVRLRNWGMEVAVLPEANLEIALLPLLHREIRVMKIGLKRPRISIQRNRDGTFNCSPEKQTAGTFPALFLGNLFLSEATFTYRDEQSGDGFAADNINLDVHGLRFTVGNSTESFNNISLVAEFTCSKVRTKSFTFADVKFTCRGQNGIFALKPVTMRLFGGQGEGSIAADFSGPLPRYSLRFSLAKFRIEEYLKFLSSKKVAEGAMNFSASLSMRGKTVRGLKQTAAGELLLHGENLILYGSDLDQEFARFESSQNFNLVDAGALFLAGPLGLAVTKGYNFASIFRESGGSSRIVMLFSDWKLEGGRAQAKDVALATRQNRIALQGRINLVTERFEEVTLALIDAGGCVRVEQKVRGPFREPLVEKPGVLMSLAGPAVNLLRKTRDFFRSGKCEVFYNGAVRAPR